MTHSTDTGQEPSAEDVETARRLLGMHEPLERGTTTMFCASSAHQTGALWPCDRYEWAIRVLRTNSR